MGLGQATQHILVSSSIAELSWLFGVTGGSHSKLRNKSGVVGAGVGALVVGGGGVVIVVIGILFGGTLEKAIVGVVLPLFCLASFIISESSKARLGLTLLTNSLAVSCAYCLARQEIVSVLNPAFHHKHYLISYLPRYHNAKDRMGDF